VVPVTWWNGRALGFDTETDGPVPTEARVITGALVHLVPGVTPQEMETMLQPERDIPQEAIDIHGITTERARDEGVLREVGIASIATTIADLAGPEVPVVGHNVVYDLTLLDREMRRLGLGRLEIEDNVFAQIQQVRMVLGERLVATFPVIDTLVLDKAVDPYRKGSRRLVDTATFYGVRMSAGSAHGATADVIASLRIAITMARRCEDPSATLFERYRDRKKPQEVVAAFYALGARSLADLHCAQVKWKAEQAEGLREYFRKTGTADPDKVSTDWPVQAIGEDESVETVSTVQ
jgi:DNA polymerase-3 subunit epsilon